MSVTAESLNNPDGCISRMETSARDCISMIDAKIRECPRVFGLNTVKVSVPVEFNITGMSRPDQQRLVYSMIIGSLRDRGFNVGIHMANTATTIYVGFTVKFTPEIVDGMNATLRGAILTDEEAIRKFCGIGYPDAQSPTD
jgi:hypothetical protein